MRFQAARSAFIASTTVHMMFSRCATDGDAHLGPDAALRPALLNSHKPVRLFDTGYDGTLVQRPKGAKIDDLKENQVGKALVTDSVTEETTRRVEQQLASASMPISFSSAAAFKHSPTWKH